MPAVRAKHKSSKRVKTADSRNGNKLGAQKDTIPIDSNLQHNVSFCSVEYPLDGPARAAFRTRGGKKVTEHQWDIYDFTRTIPCGRVTTYGALCKALGNGSPRSVGSALRKNPFAPFVPCHRVIASNLYIGGFFGEWGISPPGRNSMSGQKCNKKMEMLATEGVKFTADGYLTDDKVIWRG